MPTAIPRTSTLPEDLFEFVMEWKEKPGNLIMILHRIQQYYGYIPQPVGEEVSRITGIPGSRIYGVATFYNYFNLYPPGKHRISVCMGTACYLKGGETLVNHISEKLNVAVNAVTEDKQFSLQEVRCVGCCGLAPVVVVDDNVHGKVTPDKMDEIIEDYRNRGEDDG
ncbi:MAG: NAD(P)H-dependent oxidoreductase subunit E [Spirochaetia bacterium]